MPSVGGLLLLDDEQLIDAFEPQGRGTEQATSMIRGVVLTSLRLIFIDRHNSERTLRVANLQKVDFMQLVYAPRSLLKLLLALAVLLIAMPPSYMAAIGFYGENESTRQSSIVLATVAFFALVIGFWLLFKWATSGKAQLSFACGSEVRALAVPRDMGDNARRFINRFSHLQREMLS